MMDINQKVIIITGAAAGLGKATAVSLLGKEAVVCAIDIDGERLKELKRDYPAINTFVLDVSDPGSVQNTVDEIFNHYGKIDILINNAAIVHNEVMLNLMAGFKKHSVENWEKVIRTNLNSVFYMANSVIEKMVTKRTQGLIINISSICANGNPGQAAYSASKAGIEALTKVWSKELGAFGIRVVAVAPGYVETERTINSVNSKILDDIKMKTPLKRLGREQEIVDTICFVIGNDFVSGKIISIDGGLTL